MAPRRLKTVKEGEKLRAIQVLLNTDGGEILDQVQETLTVNSTDEASISKTRTICLALAFLNQWLKKRRSGLRKAVAEVKLVGRRSGIVGVASTKNYFATLREKKRGQQDTDSSNGNGTASAEAG